MQFTELKQSLNKLLPAYYLHGNDAFLVAKAVELISTAVAVQIPDFNFSTFDGDSADMTAVINACNSMPFGSEKRIVILNCRASISDKNLLVKYLVNPNPQCVLVITAEQKPDFKIEEVVCNKLGADMLVKLIAKDFGVYNKQIDIDAAKLLIDFCDGFYSRISGEIVKVANYYRCEKIIVKDHILNLTEKSVDYAVFELTNAIVRKNIQLGLDVLKTMLEGKGEPYPILATIVKNFRRLYFCKASAKNNLELASELGVQEMAIRISRNDVRNMNENTLRANYIKALNAEYKVKTGQLSIENAIYGLFFENVVQ